MNVLSFAGMQEVSCFDMVQLEDYMDISQYYIHEGSKGRISSKYIYQDGEYIQVDDPGTW